MIPQKNISKISNRTAEGGGRRIPENVIERDYCISWFLIGLANSPLRDILAFKGGTALRRCHFEDYRFSEDLDFTILKATSLESLLAGFQEIFDWVQEKCGMTFKVARQEPDSQSSHTVYFEYIGPIKQGGPKEIKVDITFNETIVSSVEEKGVIRTYEEFDDFLEEQKIKVYTLKEIVVEKIAAITDPARCEPRDLFDLQNLLPMVDTHDVKDLLIQKISFKGGDLESREGKFEGKEKRLKANWDKRLGHQMTELPEFDSVFRTVKRRLKGMNLFEKS